METGTPIVFNYLNYRKFLRDYIDVQKESKPSFTYRTIIQRMNAGSYTLITLILQGKRNISNKLLPKFIDALKFKVLEGKYFTNLVLFNQAEDDIEKKKYYENLLPILRRAKGTELTENEYKYFSNWHLPVIREMMFQENFVADPKWISKKLKNKITPLNVEKAIALLVELGMVQRDAGGKLQPKEVAVVTPDVVKNIALIDYHNQMIGLARESLKESNRHTKREMAGITASITKEQYENLQEDIREFRSKVTHELEMNAKGPKEVFQLNIQLFSLTKIEGESYEDK